MNPRTREVRHPWVKGAVKVWNAETGSEIWTLTEPEEPVRVVAFGKYIAGLDFDNTVYYWHPATGKAIAIMASMKSPRRDYSNSSYMNSFSSDAMRVASIGYAQKDFADSQATGTILRLWDLSRNQAHILQTHIRSAWCVALSPDGSRIACTGPDHSLKIWDFASRSVVFLREGDRDRKVHRGDGPTVLAFSPDGSRLVVGTENGLVSVLDAKSGQLIRSFEGPRRQVKAVAFRPRGLRIATGGVELRSDKDMMDENGVRKFEDVLIWEVEFPPGP